MTEPDTDYKFIEAHIHEASINVQKLRRLLPRMLNAVWSTQEDGSKWAKPPPWWPTDCYYGDPNNGRPKPPKDDLEVMFKVLKTKYIEKKGVASSYDHHVAMEATDAPYQPHQRDHVGQQREPTKRSISAKAEFEKQVRHLEDLRIRMKTLVDADCLTRLYQMIKDLAAEANRLPETELKSPESDSNDMSLAEGQPGTTGTTKNPKPDNSKAEDIKEPRPPRPPYDICGGEGRGAPVADLDGSPFPGSPGKVVGRQLLLDTDSCQDAMPSSDIIHDNEIKQIHRRISVATLAPDLFEQYFEQGLDEASNIDNISNEPYDLDSTCDSSSEESNKERPNNARGNAVKRRGRGGDGEHGGKRQRTS